MPAKYRLPLYTFLLTVCLLSVVQVKVDNPMLLAERFIKGGGWFEIAALAFYAAFVAYKMQDPKNVPGWRTITWTIFSVVFFAQLIIGLSGAEKLLMTGKLHLPIPMMILAGPLYRGHVSVMTVLFLSTVILTGPAWCSHLCYFGAFDNLASKGKPRKGILKNRLAIKSTFLLLVIAVTLVLRWLKVPVLTATLIAAGFGLAGLAVMILYSRRNGKMIHCLLYCPVGTMVNILKHINPFRMYIDHSCNFCMKCTGFCKYDALNIQDIRGHKPALTCTLCGDCLAACRENSIKYRFFNLNPETARKMYLLLTISLHAACLALARI